MMAESSAMGGAMRHSKIALMHEGRPSITEFAYDPSSPRPFAIIYDDPATSVVDAEGRCHDVPNVYIVDGSVMVTCAGVNPTSTIQAVALYIADGIIRRRS